MNQCPKCRVEKTVENTTVRKYAPEGGYFDAYCKLCRSEISKDWFKRNPGAKKKSDKKSYERFRAVLRALKAERPCFDCGNIFPPECLDWDHVRGEKLFEVGLGWNHAFDKVREEMDKCDVVCACCHRIRTQNRRNIYA
jgi:hypothetical protein